MALLDKVSGDLPLYIGGLFSLRRREALKACAITHVLSVLRLPLDDKLFEGFEHKVVEVDDVDDDNLLEHFPDCVSFIQAGLDGGGGVLVHCAMGKSRSATAVCAYLIHRYGVTPEQALAQIRESRPLCEPNDGFMHQLQLWHDMGAPADLEAAPIYQRWLYQREVEMSRACGQAPEADKIRFEDEHAPSEAAAAAFELKCKKCRRPLATSQFVLPHRPRSNTSPAATCAHYFVDPLSWMRPELEAAKLDGRLECPKCRTNVGKYAWQGMQCSCGDWVVPGISLAKGRIDEVKQRPLGAGGMGIRMPPSSSSGSARKGAGQENL